MTKHIENNMIVISRERNWWNEIQKVARQNKRGIRNTGSICRCNGIKRNDNNLKIKGADWLEANRDAQGVRAAKNSNRRNSRIFFLVELMWKHKLQEGWKWAHTNTHRTNWSTHCRWSGPSAGRIRRAAQNARYHSTTADRFAVAAFPTDSFRLLNGTFHPHSVGRRLPMRQGGRIHDNQRSSWNYWR